MLTHLIDRLKPYKIALLGGTAALALIGFWGMATLNHSSEPAEFPTVQTTQQQAIEQETEKTEETIDQANPSESSEPSETTITVDVKGAVKTEGLYQLPEGSRVNDAIKEAGGLLETADKKSINLAQKLTDEAVVYVASQGENISVVTTTAAAPASDTASGTSAKVNLNTADETQLQTITGIGAKRAKDIIAYRDTSGGFKSIDDLKNVSGIGDKTLDKIRTEVTVD